jgi:chaperonin cofactor prefoldin
MNEEIKEQLEKLYISLADLNKKYVSLVQRFDKLETKLNDLTSNLNYTLDKKWNQ